DANADDGRRRRLAAKGVDPARDDKSTDGVGNHCGSSRASASADGLIDRIEQAIGPSASQRDGLGALRTALAQTIDRIHSSCPAAAPTTPEERLKAVQDRIGAMRDALLTLRLPLEKFHDSLTDEQRWRLNRADPDAEIATTGSAGARGETRGDGCGA